MQEMMTSWSHPTWVRGLKHYERRRNEHHARSHPTWVRGLKLQEPIVEELSTKSHPTWVRGLKLPRVQTIQSHPQSHPTWVRGLKQDSESRQYRQSLVAPYVGAWIETQYSQEKPP